VPWVVEARGSEPSNKRAIFHSLAARHYRYDNMGIYADRFDLHPRRWQTTLSAQPIKRPWGDFEEGTR